MTRTSRRRAALCLGTALCLALAACGTLEEEVVMVENEPIFSEPSSGIAEPVLEAPVITPAIPAPQPQAGIGIPRAGVVTAGDIDDSLNPAAFQRYQTRAAKGTGLPAIALPTPVRLMLTGPDGEAAPGVSVTLRRPGAAQHFWEGVSGVGGRLLVFPTLHGERPMERVEIRAFDEGREVLRQTVGTGMGESRVVLPVEGGWTPEFLDLVFVIDTSGSMADEHAWLTREFAGIIREAQRAAPGVDIRYGLVAYRSPGDNYVVRNFGFTRRQARMRSWLASLDATGGSGGPEVVERGLEEAVRLPWRKGNGERLVFIVGDEPPDYDNAGVYLGSAARAAQRNVQVFGLGASDTADDLELLLRQAAVVTGGRYLFLTDDSGVGNAHGEPDIPCYRVTTLTSLLVRVLRSELTGIRHEAPPAEVIRSVGNYRAGVCAR